MSNILRLTEIAAVSADKYNNNAIIGGVCTIQGSNDWWYRTFLRYDLSMLPAGAELIKATLHMYCHYWNDNASKGTTNVSKVTADWQESTMTWSNQPSFTGTYLSEDKYAPAVGEWTDWDITTLVQEWVSGTPNYGLTIKNNNEGAYRYNWEIRNRRYSAEYATYIEVEYNSPFADGDVANCFNIRDALSITPGQSLAMESEWLLGFNADALRRAYLTYSYNDAEEYLGCTNALYDESTKSYQLNFSGYQSSLGSIRLTAVLSDTSIEIISVEATNNTDTWTDVITQFTECTLHLLEPCAFSHTNCFAVANPMTVIAGQETALAKNALVKVSSDSLLRSFITFQWDSAECDLGCVAVQPTGFDGYELTFFTNHTALGAVYVKFYIDAISTVTQSVEADSNTGVFADITEQFVGIEFSLNLLEATVKSGNGNEPGGVFEFDFTDANWRTAHADYYSVTDSNGFYTASTFQYNGKNTLRSYGIGHSGTSQTVITFNLVTDGEIAFNYCVSSEANCDWLWINIDGVDVVKQSGSVSWTAYSKSLTAGTHTLTLKYTKDSSISNNSDAGAIGYLRITGLYIPWEIRYLVQSESIIYTVEDSTLKQIADTAATSLMFRLHGCVDIPASELISVLTNPTVLIWSDSEDFVSQSTATLIATPYPQTVESPDYDMTDSTILGIEKVIAVATDSVQFAVSFDSGSSWKTFIDGVWAELSEDSSGMSATTLNSIPTESWNEVATTGKFRFRISLMDETSEFTSLIVDYLNEAEVPAESNEGDE